MNRNLALLLVFLAVISIANAIPQLNKRQTIFKKCPNPAPDNATTINKVTIQPDPLVPNKPGKITGSATTETEITEDYVFAFFITDLSFNYTPICDDGKTKSPTKEYNIDLTFDVPNVTQSDIMIATILNSKTNLTIACGPRYGMQNQELIWNNFINK
ncbi:4705_t:CDS:2, partial [Racocetra fulgida]